jgi:hypothetical protein
MKITKYKIDLLRNEKDVFIAWKPASDPREENDGDAYFHTARTHREPD